MEYKEMGAGDAGEMAELFAGAFQRPAVERQLDK